MIIVFDGYKVQGNSGTRLRQKNVEIVRASLYDPDADLRNPTGSVFCAHGSGYYVPWDKADALMHVQPQKERSSSSYRVRSYKVQEEDLMNVLKSAGGNNRNMSKRDTRKIKPKEKEEPKKMKPVVKKELPPCLIVDGYNMIYSWDELKELGQTDITTAREMLIDELLAYQAYLKWHMIIVFDGYKVQGNSGTRLRQKNVEIVRASLYDPDRGGTQEHLRYHRRFLRRPDPERRLCPGGSAHECP